MVQKHRTTAVRRKQIMNAARRLIIKQGGEHLTVRRMAEEVGISEAAIYRHFKSKKDILLLLADDIEQNLVGDIIRESSNGHSSLEALDNVLRSHLSAIEQRRGISFLVIAEIITLGDKKLNRKISEMIRRYIDRLRELLSQGIKSGEVRGDINPEAAAMLLFGMVQGLVNMWALGSHSFDPMIQYEPLWHILRQAIETQQTNQ
jgi:AcrR family transcriptional regulator